MAKRVRVEITPELVELFKAAAPAWEAQWREIITDKQVMTPEESIAAREAVEAFDRAANVMPWEHSPLSPITGGQGLREALLAKMSGTEVERVQRFAARWWKHRYEECPHLKAIDAEDGRGPVPQSA
jgi:hypothetical protein